MICKTDGSIVPCEKATDNTVLTYKCAPYYEPPHGSAQSSTCYDGTWDYTPQCIPGIFTPVVYNIHLHFNVSLNVMGCESNKIVEESDFSTINKSTVFEFIKKMTLSDLADNIEQNFIDSDPDLIHFPKN